MSKTYTLSHLAQGLEVEIKGDPNCPISGVCTIQDGKPGAITFLMNPLYKKHLPTTKASAVILLKEDADECPMNALICRDPYYIYTQIAAFFDNRPHFPTGIHHTASIGQNCQIHPTASIGANCTINDNVLIAANVIIGAGCVIGDFSEIGEGSRLDANITLYHQIKIGKHVIIASGTVIGSDGFGIAKHKGIWHKVPQLGRVIIEDHVEIGSNCSIDRGAIDDTIIEKGAKLDNLIQVGHNVRIGENTAIAGCVGISGSTVIGSNCLVGGQTGFAGHITIADNVVITGGTEVSKSIHESGIYSSGLGGLVTNLERRKNTARFHRLETLFARVKELEQALKELTERKNA
ncbi:MAG TPA: UDP-3-O-(3-hydroxymyristoyl)glucosamine N-acyltransferase [Gammaproteobacteria bacterium]|nr:UDP-3-O-(3-hydroxymyristoyl)glucosamine N-acyltransferase [Gammaproteobacteria bacterium]